MTADSLQRELMSSTHIQCLEEAWGGLHTQHGGGTGNGRHSKLNVKHKKKLTRVLVSVQEWSTEMYLLGRKPKALSKNAWHVDDRYDPEVHNAPWPMERDCDEQSLNQQDASGHQWSLCDSCHTSHDATHEHSAEGREMECTHPTHPTHQAHGPCWDQDSDDLLSSESGVGNEGPE
jgi:hypothetical protein